MNYKLICSIFAFLLLIGLFEPNIANAEISFKSNDIADGKMLSNSQVFNDFGCSGENKSPQLSWSNLPEGTKSLAITIYDPDAPTGSGWWHWVVFNISPDIDLIETDASLTSMPKNVVESITDFGSIGFGGACPPKGDIAHHYNINLYALDVEKLDLDNKSSGAKVGYYLHKHLIEKATIIALYGR